MIFFNMTDGRVIRNYSMSQSTDQNANLRFAKMFLIQLFINLLLFVGLISNFCHSVHLIFCFHSNELITRVGLPFKEDSLTY